MSTERYSTMTVNMDGIVNYWRATNQTKYLEIWENLVSQSITVEEANLRMGEDFYEIKGESK